MRTHESTVVNASAGYRSKSPGARFLFAALGLVRPGNCDGLCGSRVGAEGGHGAQIQSVGSAGQEGWAAVG
eukprot:12750628-Alexandrium_andersonii.AAC.1